MTKKVSPDVTDKNKKSEILDAYHELLEKINTKKPINQQEEKVKKDEQSLIFNASKLSNEIIIKNLAEVKLEIGKSFDKLEQHLSEEYRTLSNLQQAISIETNNLEELYAIKKSANTLEALLLAQKEKKSLFDQEMEKHKQEFDQKIEEKRSTWKKEQEGIDQWKKDKVAQLKKEREREEEEYTYSLQLDRKKELDAFKEKKENQEKVLLEKKAAFEKDFSEREKSILTQEEELKSLKQQVDLFPSKLEEVKQEAEKAIRENLERNFEHKFELTTQKYDSEKKLNLQIIASLKEKIKEQDEVIQQLRKKASDAGDQVQSIAIKAIEGASTTRRFTPSSSTQDQ